VAYADDDVQVDSAIEGWFGSTERQRALTQLILLLAVSMVFAGAGALVLVTSIVEHESTRILLAGASGAGMVLTYAFGLMRIQGSKAKFREAQERKLQEEREQALEQLQDITDLATLLKLNRQQMDAYQTLSRDQAASSYTVSQVASVIGGLILLGGAIAVVAVPAAATKISVAALTALGGAFSGYISRTFLRVYERTLIQLNFYFQQPLISSYVLSAERLIEKMGPRQRDSAYSAVVQDVLGITSRAAHAGAAATDGALPQGVPAPPALEKEANHDGPAERKRLRDRLRRSGRAHS
jgi:TRADD-N domain-containing protein